MIAILASFQHQQRFTPFHQSTDDILKKIINVANIYGRPAKNGGAALHLPAELGGMSSEQWTEAAFDEWGTGLLWICQRFNSEPTDHSHVHGCARRIIVDQPELAHVADIVGAINSFAISSSRCGIGRRERPPPKSPIPPASTMSPISTAICASCRPALPRTSSSDHKGEPSERARRNSPSFKLFSIKRDTRHGRI